MLASRKTLKFEEANQQEIQDVLACIQSVLLNPNNLQAFKTEQVGQERVNTAFAIEKLTKKMEPILKKDEVLLVNSAYRPSIHADHISVNGFSVKTDSVSAQFINELFSSDEVSVNQVIDKIDPAFHEEIEVLVNGLLVRDVLERV